MRTELPAPLGTIEIVEVYVEYDEPLLYLAKNERDSFLVNLADEDEEGQVWYFAYMSPRRVRDLRAGGIDTHDAFRFVEGGIVLALRFDQTEDRQMEVLHLLAANLDDDHLPLPGLTVTLPQRVESDPDIGALASNLRRVITEIHLRPEEGNQHEVSVAPLARFLDGFQASLDAFGQVEGGNPTSRASIKAGDKKKTRLKATRAFDGSFGLELHACETENLLAPLEASRITLAMAELVKLIEAMPDDEGFKEQLRGFRGSRVVIKFLDLLGGLKEDIAGVTIKWGSPTHGYGGEVSITKAGAAEAVRSIKALEVSEPDTYEVVGQFEGANLQSRNFTLRPEGEGHPPIYAGPIKESLAERLRAGGVELAGTSRYTATIEETTTEDVKGARSKYWLINAERIEEGE